ncbi:hypothetical protein TSOC_011346, partial [Tetrabaena socialis]
MSAIRRAWGELLSPHVRDLGVACSSVCRSAEPPRKYRPLGDKELWHEAWRATDSSPHLLGEHQQQQLHHYSSPHHQHQSSSQSIGGYDGALGREGSGLGDGGSGPYGMPHSYGGVGLAVLRSGVSDSDDDLDDGLYGEGGALQEFEAELSSPQGHGGGGGADGGLRSSLAPPQQQLQAALDKGGLAERIMALRE